MTTLDRDACERRLSHDLATIGATIGNDGKNLRDFSRLARNLTTAVDAMETLDALMQEDTPDMRRCRNCLTRDTMLPHLDLATDVPVPDQNVAARFEAAVPVCDDAMACATAFKSPDMESTARGCTRNWIEAAGQAGLLSKSIGLTDPARREILERMAPEMEVIRDTIMGARSTADLDEAKEHLHDLLYRGADTGSREGLHFIAKDAKASGYTHTSGTIAASEGYLLDGKAPIPLPCDQNMPTPGTDRLPWDKRTHTSRDADAATPVELHDRRDALARLMEVRDHLSNAINETPWPQLYTSLENIATTGTACEDVFRRAYVAGQQETPERVAALWNPIRNLYGQREIPRAYVDEGIADKPVSCIGLENEVDRCKCVLLDGDFRRAGINDAVLNLVTQTEQAAKTMSDLGRLCQDVGIDKETGRAFWSGLSDRANPLREALCSSPYAPRDATLRDRVTTLLFSDGTDSLGLSDLDGTMSQWARTRTGMDEPIGPDRNVHPLLIRGMDSIYGSFGALMDKVCENKCAMDANIGRIEEMLDTWNGHVFDTEATFEQGHPAPEWQGNMFASEGTSATRYMQEGEDFPESW